MSSVDRLVLWLHVAFVIFTIGPVTIAIMSSPRAIRTRNIGVLRYQALMTRVFGAASLGVLIFGIVLGQSLKDLGKAWLTVSMTLFVVALVLLVLIMRDQRRAIAALESMARQLAAPAPSVPDDEPSRDRSGQDTGGRPNNFPRQDPRYAFSLLPFICLCITQPPGNGRGSRPGGLLPRRGDKTGPAFAAAVPGRRAPVSGAAPGAGPPAGRRRTRCRPTGGPGRRAPPAPTR